MSTGQYNLSFVGGAVALISLLLLSGCPKAPSGTTGRPAAAAGQQRGAKAADSAKLAEDLPVPRSSRKYSDVDERVKRAWALVETSYLVVGQKYQAANEELKSTNPATLRKGAEQKAAVTQEIQQNLFGTNPQVVKLFEDALAAQPDNPLNMVAYAIYLLPRKTFQGSGYTEQYDNALAMMDRAIALWPDEANFCLIKIALMTGPLKVHEWTRSLSMEEATIQAQLPKIRQLFDQAEKSDPNNHVINYWRAQLVARLTPTDKFDTIKDEIIQQIHAGASKPVGHFAFPAPCDPWSQEAHYVELRADIPEARYYDGWMNFGFYDMAGQLAIFSGLLPKLHWPKDKPVVADLIWMMYSMGRTKPFHTTFFSWQSKILTTLMDDPAITTADKAQLATANFTLNNYYRQTTQALAEGHLLFDPKKFDLTGLSEYETVTARLDKQREIVQPQQGSYLLVIADELGLPRFPLPPDPKTWGN